MEFTEQAPLSEAPPPEPAPRINFLDWIAGTFVLSTFSPTWYWAAARQKLIVPVASFVVFTLAVATIQSLSFTTTMRTLTPEIRAAYENNDMPEIVISDGVAEVEGPQPNYLVDEGGSVVILDTTGEVRTIDRSRYESGFLLTRTELIILDSDGDLQEVSLSQIQAVVNEDPLILNEETVPAYWDRLSTWFGIGAFVALTIWHLIFRLAAILMCGLIFWGIASMVRPGTKFMPVFTSALYAVVPALYFRYLLSLIDIQFPWLAVAVHLPLWMLGYWTAVMPRAINATPETPGEYVRSVRPLRSWRALIAVPMLADFVVQHFMIPQHHVGITWGIAAATYAALAIVSLLPLLSLQRPSPAEPSAPAMG